MSIVKKCRVWSLLFLIILCGAAFSEERGGPRAAFSLKFSYGGGWTVIGDMNTHLGSLDQRYIGLPGVSGGFAKLEKYFSDWEVELKIEIRSRLSFGIATSSIFQRKNSSTLFAETESELGFDTRVVVEPEIRVSMPLSLRAYYSVYSSDRLKVFAGGGVSWYAARMKEAYLFNAIYPLSGVYYNNRYWDVRNSRAAGLVGGGGLEFRIVRGVSFVAEAQARYVKISGLKGTVRYETNYGSGLTIRESGTLHFFSMSNYYDLDIMLPMRLFSDVAAGVEEVQRKAILNLSGVALRAGIKVGLFRIR